MRENKKTDFERNCPVCKKYLYYSGKYKLDRAIKNNSYCFSCRRKEISKSKEYIEKLSHSIKKSWEKDEERRKNQSNFSVNFWKNLSDEERKNICNKMSENFNRSEQRINALKEIGKANWASENFRKKWKESNDSPEVSEKRRNNILKQHKDPNSKLNSNECKEKIAQSRKENWNSKNEEEKKKILDNLAKTLHSFHSKSRSTSKLELWVAKNIEHFGFKSKGTVAGFCVDIIHETLPIIVEVNGDFWHANPKIYSKDWINNINKKTAQEIWARDAKRLQKLKNAGYEIIVLWQNDIKTNKNFITEIKNFVENYKIKNNIL